MWAWLPPSPPQKGYGIGIVALAFAATLQVGHAVSEKPSRHLWIIGGGRLPWHCPPRAVEIHGAWPPRTDTASISSFYGAFPCQNRYLTRNEAYQRKHD